MESSYKIELQDPQRAQVIEQLNMDTTVRGIDWLRYVEANVLRQFLRDRSLMDYSFFICARATEGHEYAFFLRDCSI